MKYDCNEQVEKHSGHIFGAILVKVDGLNFLIWKTEWKRKYDYFILYTKETIHVDHEINSLTITIKDLGNIVLDSDEHDGKLGCDLEWHKHTHAYKCSGSRVCTIVSKKPATHKLSTHQVHLTSPLCDLSLENDLNARQSQIFTHVKWMSTAVSLQEPQCAGSSTEARCTCCACKGGVGGCCGRGGARGRVDGSRLGLILSLLLQLTIFFQAKLSGSRVQTSLMKAKHSPSSTALQHQQRLCSVTFVRCVCLGGGRWAEATLCPLASPRLGPT